MDEKALGRRLQNARKAAGLTQQELCHRANLSYSTLAKIERGAIRSPSIFTIQTIASALGLSMDELIGHGPAPSTKPKLHTKNGVSFIYFDVNGCLIHFFQRAFTHIGKDTGLEPGMIEAAFWHFNDEACRGTISMADFNAAMAQKLGLDEFDWQPYYLEAVEPIKPMQELLKWAAERYKVGLLSDIMPGLLAALRQQGKLPDLTYDAIVDSSEVGTIKPEAKIYDIATERAGCPPGEILLIDDSRANLMAAERSGWHVIWFNDFHFEEATEYVRAAIQPAN